MDYTIRHHLDNLYSKDAEARYHSFQYLLEITNDPVDWADIAWDDLMALLHGDNHQRAVAVQLLSNLSKSEPMRALSSLDQIMKITHDKRFVTARHALQALWKIGVASPALQHLVLHKLRDRFFECEKENECTMIRYDIIEVLRKMYDTIPTEKIKSLALELIEKEPDAAHRDKYSTLWKDQLQTQA